MAWLKTNIEKDFCISIYFCEHKCMTQVYDSSLDLIEKRIRMDIGEIKDIGCVGNSTISTEELVAIAQRDNNGAVLVELAKAVRYPKTRELTRAVKVLGYSPSFGKSVIFFQWMVVIVAYLFNWLFVSGFPDMLSAAFAGGRNVLRRSFGLGPAEPSSPHILKTEEQMAELARHRVISEHTPWVRYGIYYLVASLSGKQLSTRTWKIDETAASKRDKDEILIYGNQEEIREDGTTNNPDRFVNEHLPTFEHVMLNERRLIMKMTSDECSAARLLYSIALHSLQVVLLCNAFGYPPAHILVGSFRDVQHGLQNTMIVFRNARLDSVFKKMYGWRRNGLSDSDPNDVMFYLDSLLERLNSQLFTGISEPDPTYIPVNLALMYIDKDFLDRRHNGNSRYSEYQPFEVDGVDIGKDLSSKLCKGYLKCARELDYLTEKHLTSRVFWGVITWLLYTLFNFYRFNTLLFEEDDDNGFLEYVALADVNIRLGLLINAPFQMVIPDGAEVAEKPKSLSKGSLPYKRFMVWYVTRNIAFKKKKYCSTVPMWCVCSEDCRGICTLIVNELNMTIPHVDFLDSPCAFSISPSIYPAHSPYLFNQNRATLRLLCAANSNQFPRLTSKHRRFRLFKPNDVKQPKTADSCAQENKESGLKDTLADEWDDSYRTYRSSRISGVEYPLSDLVHEDVSQLVVVLGDKLLRLTSDRDSNSAGAEEPFHESVSQFYSRYGGKWPEYIRREIKLNLPSTSETDYMSEDIHEDQDQQPTGRYNLQRSVVFDSAALGDMVAD
ncbi:hypothetical protein IWW45_002053 [Coemansia sp. RSA 485]|nr:hypothetical protein IWW45_002053 [Coemansia sp. RSA 485]